jgi:HEAT repeat protein
VSRPQTPVPDPVPPEIDERSDFKVVMQFFLVPLSLVAVLVVLFFGFQFLRDRRPDPRQTLQALERQDGFLGAAIGDLKRWQSGYDLSLLLRSESGADQKALVPDLIQALREASARGDLKLRRYLTLTLGQAADPRAAEALGESLASDNAETRLLAVWGLMRLNDPGLLPELRAALQDQDAGVRKMAAFSLGALEDKASLPELRAALDDPAEDVGWNAGLALARLGDRSAVPVLLAMLDRGLTAAAAAEGEARPSAEAGPSAELGLNAVRGLLLLNAPEARPLLERAAASPDETLRSAARLALQEITEAKPVAEAAAPEIR